MIRLCNVMVKSILAPAVTEEVLTVIEKHMKRCTHIIYIFGSISQSWTLSRLKTLYIYVYIVCICVHLCECQ